jgi:DNA gyrase subunit A
MVTTDGYVKRLPPDTFKKQSRGGKGVIGLNSKEEEGIDEMKIIQTHDNVMFFTNRGRVFQTRAFDLPQSSRTAKGQALVNFLQLSPNEKVTASLALSAEDYKEIKYLTMVTTKGLVKKTPLEDFANVRKSGLIAIKLKPEDNLEWVKPTSGKDEIIIATKNGQAIRFKETDARSMGRSSSGVRAIRLKNNDVVVGMDIIDPKNKKLEFLIVSENGLGKRTDLSQYKVQGRGGSGIKTMAKTTKTGSLVYAKAVDKDETSDRDLLIMSHKGQVIRLPYKSVSTSGRATQGVRLMRFKDAGDKVGSVTMM